MNEGKSCRGIVRGLMGVLLLGILGSGLAPASVMGDDVVSRYNQLKREFQCSTVIPEKDRRIEAIQASILNLEAMLRENTRGKVSDKCLYLIGQGYHHLYDITRNRENLKTAIEHYRQVAQKYPSSPIADDAQYLLGMLHLQDNPSQAYIEFSKVGLFFPKGDKRHKAAEMAEKLEKRLGCGPKKRSGSIPSPPNEFSASVSGSPPGETPAAPNHAAAHGSTNTSKPSPSEPSGSESGICPTMRQLHRIHHVTGDEYTRVVLYTDGPVPFEKQITHADPKAKQSAKIAVLLKDCILNPKLTIDEPERDPFLKRVSASQLDGAQSRVILDVDSIDAYRIFSLSDPFRVIVDVRGKLPERKSAAAETDGGPSEPPARAEQPESAVISRENSRKPQKSPVVPSLAQQLALDVKRIVIDPGHGGKDKGAIGPNNVYEKDVVLAIAKIL
ncbi:MAG: hypothetical protein GX443_10370, partial [Deltaproteobacteria bacterium]|nr:hypothetical protein [Deltaproteobacteria bacterium]